MLRTIKYEYGTRRHTKADKWPRDYWVEVTIKYQGPRTSDPCQAVTCILCAGYWAQVSLRKLKPGMSFWPCGNDGPGHAFIRRVR